MPGGSFQQPNNQYGVLPPLQPPLLVGDPQITGGPYRTVDNNNQYGPNQPPNNQYERPPYLQNDIVQPPPRQYHYYNDSAINKIRPIQIILFIATLYGKF